MALAMMFGTFAMVYRIVGGSRSSDSTQARLRSR